MDSKDGSKKKGISQDLLLDDFFKPPAEEEPVESKKKEPEPKPEKKASIKKDLLLDDFFGPPATEETLKEPPHKEVKKEKEPEISTTYKEVKKPAPSVVEKPQQQPLPVTPPPQRSLKELLEEPIFEAQKETPVSPQYKSPTPQIGVPPQPVVITPTPRAEERKKFPLLPVIGIVVIVVVTGVGGYIFFGGKGKEKGISEEKPKSAVVEIPIQKQPVETPVQQAPEESKVQEAVLSPEPALSPEPESKPRISAEEKPVVEARKEEVVEKPAPKPVAKVNRFIVTVGPFKTQEEAKAQEIKIKILGYTPKVSSAMQTVEVYNLYIDPPLPEAEANVIRLKMSIKGFPAELVDAGENKRIKLGSYSSINEAIEKKNQASESGYTVTIDIGKSSERVYNLEMGFPESERAKDAVEKLKGMGMEARIVEKKV